MTWSTARPIRRDARGYLATAEGTASLINCVATVLDTNVGESEFEQEFGSRLGELAHEPNDAALVAEMRHESADAIARSEPRVVIDSATFERDGRTTSGVVTLRAKASKTPLATPARVSLRGE